MNIHGLPSPSPLSSQANQDLSEQWRGKKRHNLITALRCCPDTNTPKLIPKFINVHFINSVPELCQLLLYLFTYPRKHLIFT